MEIINLEGNNGLQNGHFSFQGDLRDYQFRICYEDTDAGGVVYHAKYLGIAERARTECMRRLGGTMAELYHEHQLILVVRQVEIHYRRPLFLDDVVNVRTDLITALGASCWLSQIFSKDDEVATEIKLQLVCLKKDSFIPVSFPSNWKKIFEALSQAKNLKSN